MKTPIIALIAGIFIMTYSSKLNKRTSKNGFEFLEFVEGNKLKRYKDSAGYWTIGVGHKLLPDETYTTITAQQSLNLLRKDVSIAEKAINNNVKVPLNQNQYDALVAFVFNVGVYAFEESTMLKKLNAYDYSGALAEFPRWNKETIDGVKVVNAGLIKRRAHEQELFNA